MVHASVSCPGCKRLLKTSTETCPECGTFIARAYAAQNIKDNVTVAQAYVLAQRIESFNPFVWFTLALAAGLHVAAVVVELAPFRALVLLPLIYSMLMLLPIRQWFRQFGGFESDDEEFSAARRKVKGALRLRLGVIAAQIIGLTLKWLLW